MIRNGIQTGPNRTGIATSTVAEDVLLEGFGNVPSAPGDETAIDGVRTEYLVEDASIGSLAPSAAETAGAVSCAAEGADVPVFVDKIGERLAFERTGYRLYTALVDKLDASEPLPGGPTRDELEVIRTQELAHAELLHEAMLSLGADPTAITPSADVAAVSGAGLLQVVCDPRMNLKQSLEAMLIAELVDHDGWTLLVDLANGVGNAELAARFDVARTEEVDHLVKVRGWVVEATLFEARAAAGAEGELPDDVQ
ncbi:MAG: ferritin-like domain-containing protein [Labilithrix sp.]|nr:ferritin-like domain-containing protein [Labilithrix sp.]